MMRFDTVACSLDLDAGPGAAGKAMGWLDLDHSDDDHGFAAIRAPIGQIGAGDGPAILLVAGNHGDEYEGQVILRKLYEALQPGDVTGRLILLPALNTPAVLARSRVSPLDRGNMNRVFPGGAGQGPTRALAGFVTRHLLPRAGLVVDLHSGGTATQYLDATYLTLTGRPETDRRGAALARAMGLPWTMVTKQGSTGGDLDSTVLDHGIPMVSCELGGMGRVSRRSLANGWSGLLNLLRAEGALTDRAAARLGARALPPTRFLDLDAAGNATAMRHALVEPLVGLGDAVKAGQAVAILHDFHDMAAPQPLTAPVAGRVMIRRRNALVEPGQHVFVIGPEIAPEELDRRLG